MKFGLTDLRIFLAAVDTGSFSAAAAQNNIVVAAVSARIRRLEDAFRVELFERTGRGIRTTLAGDMFASHARKIVDDARRVESELDKFAEGRRGRVRLLSNTNMLAEHMPRALGTFLAANPDISVDVSDRPSHEVVTMLKNGEADIGIVADSADMTGLEQWRFVPDRLVLIAPRDFFIPDETINYARILDFPMIGMPETAALSQFLGRLARELGRDIKMRIRMNGFEGIARMVESGAGVAIIPGSGAQRYQTFIDFRILEIADAWADRKLFLCVRHEAELPGFARRLLTHLRAYRLTEVGGDQN